MKRKMSARNKYFIQGIACLAGFIVEQNGHVCPYECFTQMGINWDDMVKAEVDQHDIDKFLKHLDKQDLERIGFRKDATDGK